MPLDAKFNVLVLFIHSAILIIPIACSGYYRVYKKATGPKKFTFYGGQRGSEQKHVSM